MSDAEETLSFQLTALGIPFEREVVLPGRKFRYDFKVDDMLIEVQGGVWLKGESGHSSGVGITRDCKKSQFACENGFRFMAVTTGQVTSGEAVNVIEKCRR